ncbi:fibrobacter succinogenes major paralogous domain-containing protein [Prosthecochloris sp. HL-130-GSB]|jgi:uncharacterized protein (TIGR02145 family)|uniref:fibrobacter succinogenes major paralogous domain-containing protein n=1 Tax=Prosthecochloris sp. HL-130-GSB TaxID=1974213 RepID=UPI000A1C043B|nr:fibrobacter succinogenes major paralogous domain-containing protein [Prosthecochloris sp. HL-130-GSB]ARM30476.1 hypothetical protein B9H02_02960 [Prosthecochloris sp. HL-130-GSB]
MLDAQLPESITIGDQIWMVSNLNVTRFRNGDAITEINDPTQWRHQASAGRCSIPGQNDDKTGKLYNWYAVTDSRGLAPEGWRIPNEEDWCTLIEYLGGMNSAGGALKQHHDNHWKSPNAGANNKSGFSALPAGMRTLYGDFMYHNTHCYFWSSTPLNDKHARVFSLNYFDPSIHETSCPFGTGASIRCIKA